MLRRDWPSFLPSAIHCDITFSCAPYLYQVSHGHWRFTGGSGEEACPRLRLVVPGSEASMPTSHPEYVCVWEGRRRNPTYQNRKQLHV